MTALSSRRAGAVQGPQRAATGPEPSSGVGPAFSLGEPEPPLRSDLELGALPTVVPCARLHARHVLREWGSNGLAPDSELLVSELVTNAVKATAGRDGAAVRLRLSGHNARVLIEVWDADPRAPEPKDLGEHGTPDPHEERTRAVPGGGAQRALGLVPHPGACGQGYLVRAGGFIARAARSGAGGGNHRSFG